MSKESKKIRLLEQKQIEEDKLVLRYRLAFGGAMLLVCIVMSVTLFIGWQRGMAKPGQSKFQREQTFDTPTAAHDVQLMSILNKENNELLKIVTEGTKRQPK